MNRKDILAIACFGAVFIGALLSPVIPIAVKNTTIMKAHAQQQEEDKLFIIMKVQKSDIDNAYELNNVASNLNKVLLSSVANNNNNQVKFSVGNNNNDVLIFNTSITYDVPVEIIDNSNPNTIKSTNVNLIADITENFTKELDKQTGTIKYSGQGLLLTGSKSFHIDLNGVVYSNGTGIVETKER
jgi:hypothetical protein